MSAKRLTFLALLAGLLTGLNAIKPLTIDDPVYHTFAAHLAEKVAVRWLMLGGVVVFCASLWLISRAAAMWQVTTPRLPPSSMTSRSSRR